MMKIAWVALYLLNVNGGQPELVATYILDPSTAMARCEASMANYKSAKWGQFQLVCIPAYKPQLPP